MDSPGDQAGYALADLAARSSLPARTIRFYQSVGVLPKPDRRGRIAVYRDEHLERLRVIAELRDRGLTLAGIRHLLDRRMSPGVSVGDWLGLDSTLRGRWSEDRPRFVDDYDGGRQVTVYIPLDQPEAVVFAGDGQLISQWGGVLEAADVLPR